MNVVNRFSYLAFELNTLIDSGKKLDLKETLKHAEDGTILPWLKREFPELDISIYEEDDHYAVNELFGNLANAVGSRKFGVMNDGLCLLVAYCIEGLQQLKYNEGAYKALE